MARKIKDSRRFGLPSGRYRSGRRCIRMNSGKVKTLYQCNLKGGSNMTKLCIRKQPKRSAYNRVRINLLRRSTKKQYQVFRTINGELKTFEVQNVAANGYRIINLNCLQKHITDLTMHAVSCEKARQLVAAGREPIVLESQVAHYGLAVILLAKCQGCQLKVHMETSPKLKTDGSRHYDINVRAVWGSIVSGNGLAHLNEQLASMDSPTMSQNTYQVIENEINSWWKEVVEREMSVAIEEEKKIAIDKNRYHEGIPSVTVICDGGWSKRSHKHTYNALGGVAVIIGAETKKILHVGIRNKYCYICNRNESLGTTPKQHECFKNWNQSSQSMESDVIVEGFLKANDHGIRYMNFIADGDSSMHAQIMDRVPVWGKHVKKLECANHITKCLRSNLEKLVTENPSYKGKGKLCKRTRVRIVSAVRCAIRKRSDETNRVLATKKLDHDIRNTTSHIYGDHKLCNPDFCKAKSNMSHQDQNQDDDSEVECEDIFQEQSEFWDAGTSLQAQEDSRGHYNLEPSDLQLGMRQDLSLLLNNVAKKSSSLIGNFTTNLAECWMHIRSKFDGGPNWSPNVWAQTTETTSGLYFDKLYKQREQCIDNNNKSKDKKEIKERRWKRKMSSVKESNSSKAKEHYGIESIQPESDVSEK
ncbi:Hypothetical predicted protein [Mytilus galloprovincialis]|uniref:Mutator-like transposase domain-containing protein n=2 Tax=Mytilus galloprovincialis TaxID=29158 RepID=A0A8B6CW65_MYTGA|nr:Hypothetical predicted protein [Mytilus galloprovincialis]